MLFSLPLPANARSAALLATLACACNGIGDAESESESESESASESAGDDGVYGFYTGLQDKATFLINDAGLVVHTWQSATSPAVSAHLLANGDLLRTGIAGEAFGAAGAGGLVESQSWDGAPLWSFEYSNDQHRLHHDLEPMPNGHVLLIAWEGKTVEEAIAAGRDPMTMDAEGLWPDTLLELDPESGTIVWEWHVWDHLVQDFDEMAPNFDDVAAHPERIDLNYVDPYVVKLVPPSLADWNHFNGIDYNPELDQIVVSAHHFHEIWIIDHSTTSAEAATSAGGAAGRGGDLLYRWGNPATYRSGGDPEQQLFHQHDPRWIPPGRPGAGDITVFNNGLADLRPFTAVVQITPPLEEDNTYSNTGGTFGPDAPNWEYIADPPESFFSEIVGSAQRLANGNTLINEGIIGRFFIITPEGETVWEQENERRIFRLDGLTADEPALAGRDLSP